MCCIRSRHRRNVLANWASATLSHASLLCSGRGGLAASSQQPRGEKLAHWQANRRKLVRRCAPRALALLPVAIALLEQHLQHVSVDVYGVPHAWLFHIKPAGNICVERVVLLPPCSSAVSVCGP